MKKLFALLSIFGLAFVLTINAQEKKIDLNEKKEMKEHVCTSACENDHHAILHGEKGHKCSNNCIQTEIKKRRAENKINQKEHTCSADCKDGKHIYAHGEKGHTCTTACPKM